MKYKIINLASIILLVISIGQIIFNLKNTWLKTHPVDFLVYKQAVDNSFQGEFTYKHFITYSLDRIPFNYPPSTLLILSPIKNLSPFIGEFLLVLFSIILLILSIFLISKIIKIKISLSQFFVISALLIQTFPVKFTLVLGQINLIILGLLIISLYFYFTNKQNVYLYILSAFLFSLACGLKIFPLYALFLFILLKDYYYPFLVLGFFSIFNLLAGINISKDYFLNVLPGLSKINSVSFYDQSFFAFFIRLGIDFNYSRIFSYVVFLGLLSLVLFRFYKENNKFKIAPFYFFLIFTITSYNGLFSWQHHLVYSFPLIVYLVVIQLKKISLMKMFCWLALWLILVFHFKNPFSPYFINPFIASYQTISLFILTLFSLFKNPALQRGS